MKNLLFICLLYASLYSDNPELYQTGEKLYFSKGCNGCHGIKAQGMLTYPSLANVAKGFLTYKLKRFREGKSDTQQQELMLAFALELKDDEIDALVHFLHNFTDEQTQYYDIEVENWGDGGS